MESSGVQPSGSRTVPSDFRPVNLTQLEWAQAAGKASNGAVQRNRVWAWTTQLFTPISNLGERVVHLLSHRTGDAEKIQKQFLAQWAREPYKQNLAKQLLQLLGPRLCASAYVLDKVTQPFTAFVNQGEELADLSQLLKLIELAKPIARERALAGTPLSAFDPLALEILTSCPTALHAGEFSNLKVALLLLTFPANTQVLTKGLPLLCYSLENATPLGGGEISRYCATLKSGLEELDHFQRNELELPPERQSLLADGYHERTALIYEKHLWSMKEGQVLPDGNRIPSVAVCHLGVAVPGVSAREAYIELDLRPLRMQTFDQVEKVPQVIADIMNGRSGMDVLKVHELSGRGTLQDVIAFVRAQDPVELTHRLGENPLLLEQGLDDPRQAQRRIEVLLKELVSLEGHFIGGYSADQLTTFMEVAGPFMEKMNLLYPQLLISAQQPEMPLPQGVHDVTLQLFNPEARGCLDDIEKLLKTRLIAPHQLRLLNTVLASPEIRKVFTPFAAQCLKQTAKLEQKVHQKGHRIALQELVKNRQNRSLHEMAKNLVEMFHDIEGLPPSELAVLEDLTQKMLKEAIYQFEAPATSAGASDGEL